MKQFERLLNDTHGLLTCLVRPCVVFSLSRAVAAAMKCEAESAQGSGYKSAESPA